MRDTKTEGEEGRAAEGNWAGEQGDSIGLK